MQTRHLHFLIYFQISLDLFLLCSIMGFSMAQEFALCVPLMLARHAVSKNLRGTFLTDRGDFSNSLRITSLADPYPLTPIESHAYRKHRGGWGPPVPFPLFDFPPPLTSLEWQFRKKLGGGVPLPDFRVSSRLSSQPSNLQTFPRATFFVCTILEFPLAFRLNLPTCKGSLRG
jgi:hypothetical protein